MKYYSSIYLKRYKRVGFILSILEGVSIGLITYYSVFSIEGLRDVENEVLSKIFATTFNYQLLIVFIAISLIALKRLIYNYKIVKVQPLSYRMSLMREMLNHLFNNNREIRITIFKEVGFFKKIIFHLRYFLTQIPKGNFKIKSGSYIQVSQRFGWEMKNSKTSFFYSPNTKTKCQGIAARVIQNLEGIKVERLPNINDINLDEIDMNSEENAEVKKVRDYMNRTFTTDFQTLKRLNAKAIHFKADAIYGSDGIPVGVLIIDCLSGDSPFNDNNMEHFTHYLNLIGQSFGGNIYG